MVWPSPQDFAREFFWLKSLPEGTFRVLKIESFDDLVVLRLQDTKKEFWTVLCDAVRKRDKPVRFIKNLGTKHVFDGRGFCPCFRCRGRGRTEGLFFGGFRTKSSTENKTDASLLIGVLNSF